MLNTQTSILQAKGCKTNTLLIGLRVRGLRETARYSIEDLALTCGLTTEEIDSVENGVEIDAQKLRRIAAALQTSFEELTEIDPEA